jgi:hypothetical protein
MMFPNMPNFFVIGAPKAGTTTFYYYLKQHPQIFMSPTKEPHFFDYNFHEGVEYYVQTFFRGAERYLARGEASPSYLMLGEVVIPRIRSVYQGEIPKFIILLRDPVARAWSHYLHRVRVQHETEDFQTALALEERRRQGSDRLWIGYYSDGLYAKQLKTWFHYFPREHFLILFSEEFSSQAETTLDRVFAFLSLERGIPLKPVQRKNTAFMPRNTLVARLIRRPSVLKTSFKKILPRHTRRAITQALHQLNASRRKALPQLNPHVAALLRARYLIDIAELEKMLDVDLSAWRQGSSVSELLSC